MNGTMCGTASSRSTSAAAASAASCTKRGGGSHGRTRTTPVYDGTARCKLGVSRSAAGSI